MNALPYTTEVISGRLNELRMQLHRSERDFGAGHPNVASLRARISALETERAFIVGVVSSLVQTEAA